MADLTLTEEQVTDLMSFASVFTVIEDAVQNLDLVGITDEEVAVFALLSTDFRVMMTTRLIELTEIMRERLRDLDGRILQLTPSLQEG